VAYFAEQIAFNIKKFSAKNTNILDYELIKVKKPFGWFKISTEAIVARTDSGDLYIVFQGSWNFTDWLANFFTRKVSLGGLFRDPYGAKAHKGFLSHFHNIHDDIISTIAEFTTKHGASKNIIIGGHSLGGAIGELFALHLSERTNKDSIHIVTLGKPKVGNQKLKQYFQYRFRTHQVCRIVMRNDYVPLLPCCGYVHNTVEIKLNGKRRFPWISIMDHSVFRYFDYLESLSTSQLTSELAGKTMPSSNYRF
jgi:predicted lipase